MSPEEKGDVSAADQSNIGMFGHNVPLNVCHRQTLRATGSH